jgi:hypothetical protein
MPAAPRTRQQRFRGSKRHLQFHKSVCQAALSRCGRLLQRCLRGIRAKKATSPPLRHTGVARKGNKYEANLPQRFHLGSKYFGAFGTQEQAAQAIAAEVGGWVRSGVFFATRLCLVATRLAAGVPRGVGSPCFM